MSQVQAGMDWLMQEFPDEAGCAERLINQRWPAGFVCPRCHNDSAVRLNCRAWTYDCPGCGLQTSITAGTLMHRSKQPLRVWLQAIQLLADRADDLRAAEFGRLLGIKYTSAALLMRKLRPLKIEAMAARRDELLDGRVLVSHRAFRHHRAGYSSTIAAALEVSSSQLRMSRISDDTAVALEVFVRRNVKHETTLVSSSNEYRGIYGYEHEFINLEEAKAIRGVLSNIDPLLPQGATVRPEQVDKETHRYVAFYNDRLPPRPISGETLLGLVLGHLPISYWDMVGHENPRKGYPTTRWRPRHRRTANGMRQDRPGS